MREREHNSETLRTFREATAIQKRSLFPGLRPTTTGELHSASTWCGARSDQFCFFHGERGRAVFVRMISEAKNGTVARRNAKSPPLLSMPWSILGLATRSTSAPPYERFRGSLTAIRPPRRPGPKGNRWKNKTKSMTQRLRLPLGPSATVALSKSMEATSGERTVRPGERETWSFFSSGRRENESFTDTLNCMDFLIVPIGIVERGYPIERRSGEGTEGKEHARNEAIGEQTGFSDGCVPETSRLPFVETARIVRKSLCS